MTEHEPRLEKSEAVEHLAKMMLSFSAHEKNQVVRTTALLVASKIAFLSLKHSWEARGLPDEEQAVRKNDVFGAADYLVGKLMSDFEKEEAAEAGAKPAGAAVTTATSDATAGEVTT